MLRRFTAVLLPLALSTAIATPCLAAVDCSFLDGLSLDELTEVRDEVDSRIRAEKKADSAKNPTEFGAWKPLAFVDEFLEPTDEGYVLTKVKDGSFSNSVTTNSELSVDLYLQTYDDGKVAVNINLYEYGWSQVHSWYDMEEFDVSIRCANGDTLEATAYLPEDSKTLLILDDDGGSAIKDVLSAGGKVSFRIVSQKSGDSYLFTIDDTSYFDNAWNAMLAGEFIGH